MPRVHYPFRNYLLRSRARLVLILWAYSFSMGMYPMHFFIRDEPTNNKKKLKLQDLIPPIRSEK